jgi:hypothetical protein
MSPLGKTLSFRDVAVGGGADAAFAALSGKPAVLESFGLAGFGHPLPEEEHAELDSIELRLSTCSPGSSWTSRRASKRRLKDKTRAGREL